MRSSLLQTSHDADRHHRTTTMMQQQHWQQRRAHAPCTCRRTADILHGWNPQTLSRVICDDPTGRARVQAVLFGGATCSLLLPFPVILTSHHTPQKYEGTLRLFAPSNPAHHADPVLVLNEVADALAREPTSVRTAPSSQVGQQGSSAG